MRGLNGKIAVVTGAASGIGQATCERLAEEGMQVVGVDRNPLGKSVSLPMQLDLTAPDAAATIVRQTIGQFGRIDLLVNCAGIGRAHSIDQTTDEEWATFLSVNLTTVMSLSRACLPGLLETRGSIVNVGSIFGLVGFKRSGGYSVSKAAIHGLTTQMAADYGPRGVRINAVAPGAIRTPLTESRLQPGEWHHAATVGLTPMGRSAEAAEVAAAIAYLGSDDASYVNGHVLVVDGGWAATRYLAG